MSLTTESQAARVIPFTAESCDYSELARLRDENAELRAQLEASKAYGERIRQHVERCRHRCALPSVPMKPSWHT